MKGRAWLAPVGAALSIGCGAGTVGQADTSETGSEAAAQTVRYVLDWAPAKADSGSPKILQMSLRTWSLQLVPCPQPAADVGWSLVSEAWADHATEADSSLWVAAATETAGAVLTSPIREVHGTPCELLWVVSAGTLASGAKPGAPAFSALVQWSDGSGPHTRTLVTPVADAVKVPLGALPQGKVWSVRLVRSLEGALDGLDLAHGATEALAWTVLDRIVQAGNVRFD